MSPFQQHTGLAASLPVNNVDTDQIIPSREMKAVSREGLGQGLFAGWRYVAPESREPDPHFVLNRPEQAGTSVLIAGSNFGCGSSREHAVWALAEYGIRAICAKSFGEIFYGNCLRNGILPIILQPYEIELMHAFAAGREVEVDLPGQQVRCDTIPGWVGRFEISAYPKRLLIEGLDPIGLTLQRRADILAFQDRDRALRPWLYSATDART